MLTYKGRSWCGSSRKCGNMECPRNFTPELPNIEKTGLPLSMVAFKDSDCGFVPVVEGSDDE